MQIAGLDTNVNFLIDLASHPSFQAADVHTGFIDQHIDSLFPPITVTDQTISQAIGALITNERIEAKKRAVEDGSYGNPFADCDGFRINSNYVRTIDIESNGNKYKVELKYVGSNYEIKINDGEWKPITLETVQDENTNRFTLKLNLDGDRSIFSAVINENIVDIFNEVCFGLHIIIIIREKYQFLLEAVNNKLN